MSEYKTLMRVLFLFYLLIWFIIAIAFLFMDEPQWLSGIAIMISLINLLVISIFNKAMNILPDEN